MMLRPLALYIHWPFCLAKCPYCDFNSHVRERIDQISWRNALLRELGYWQERLGSRQLTSIFFGGGTPSLMPAQTVAALIDAAISFWPPSLEIEITLEANPTSAEAQKFRDFANAGVNRLSLGVQALNEADLKLLGRKHDVGQARAALNMAAACFKRYSFDLIYARKNQSLAAWEAELREALSMANGHLSLYQLTIEPDTVFALQTAQGARLQADEEVAIAMYELTQQILEAAAMPAYEISNHAAKGQESRHNLTYWHYGEYVGIGPGAHGRVWEGGAVQATQTIRAPEAWRQAVETHGHGLEAAQSLSLQTQMEEALLVGMRLRQGIDKAQWQQRFGAMPDSFINQAKKQQLQDLGLLFEDATHLRATAEGLMKLNAVIGQLMKAA